MQNQWDAGRNPKESPGQGGGAAPHEASHEARAPWPAGRRCDTTSGPGPWSPPPTTPTSGCARAHTDTRTPRPRYGAHAGWG